MTHRIRRQVLDLELSREAGAMELQRRAGRVFQEKVLPRLEELFSAMGPPDRIVRLEKLEIDLGTISETNWERHFVERCVEQISRQLMEVATQADAASKNDALIIHPEENTLAVFRYFLETGTLPWYARGMALKTLETELMQHLAMLLQVVLPVLQRNDAALRRLIWQFSHGFTERLLDILLGLAPGGVFQYIQTLESRTARKLSPDQRHDLFKKLLGGEIPERLYFQTPNTEVVGPRPSVVAGPETDSITDPSSEPDKQAPVERAEEKAKIRFDDEGILIDNAGIVLLGVYLPAFFQALHLTDGRAFISTEDQYRAVHLLHFLATSVEQPEEPVLVLPKLLCGLPLEEPVPLDVHLSEVEKNESVDLLKAVVQNWPVLKNTSPDGLRSGFLQRSGLLSHQENQSVWLLRPERMGQDLLLERLPWSISVIKLPWMAEAVQVEW